MLVLIWLGWSGAGDELEDQGVESAGEVLADRVAAAVPSDGAGSQSAAGDRGSRAAVGISPDPESVELVDDADQSAGQLPAVGVAVLPDAAIADRLWGCLRALAEAGHGSEFHGAFLALAEVEGMELSEAQRWLIADGRRNLEGRLRARLLTLDAAVRTGAVVEAVDELRPMVRAEHRELQRQLVELLQGRCGWPDWRQDVDEMPPAPAALARGLRVRLRYDGAWTEGVVMTCRDQAVTLRVRTRRGDRFPSLPRIALEPSRPESVLARDQSMAALRSGDSLLATAWRVRAAALD